jgi:hypothetical protein
MNDLQLLDSATAQLDEIRSAISAGDYSSLQGLLLNQTVILHKLGVELIELASTQAAIKYKAAYADIALRAFGQSQKAMGVIKLLGVSGS